MRSFQTLLNVSSVILLTLSMGRVSGQEVTVAQLREVLHFHAPFDGTPDAKIAEGDRRILTAESLARKTLTPGMHREHVQLVAGEGRYGDCLRFTGRTDQVLCFPGTAMHYADKDWSGSVSFWMKLTPDTDLPAGYCDPLQITQKAWNDGAFFVDFDKDLPRDFRLGTFSDLLYWNPENIEWDKWPVEKRPMVTVHKPPFTKTEWTHVAFTFQNINAADKSPATATLYLNGQRQGELRQPMKFTWEKQNVLIMLGIEYVGDLDDLMIFRRTLTEKEIQFLATAKESL
jgi:hypothetical protein